jgi:hypothetical protein
MAIDTTTVKVSRSENVLSRAVQYFTTDSATAADTVFNFGFVPDRVRFINLTDRIQDEWFAGMAADTALHTVAAGTVTLATSGGITVNTAANAAGTVKRGDISIPAALMVASKSFVIMAEMA